MRLDLIVLKGRTRIIVTGCVLGDDITYEAEPYLSRPLDRAGRPVPVSLWSADFGDVIRLGGGGEFVHLATDSASPDALDAALARIAQFTLGG